jgi:hypothetical protein
VRHRRRPGDLDRLEREVTHAVEQPLARPRITGATWSRSSSIARRRGTAARRSRRGDLDARVAAAARARSSAASIPSVTKWKVVPPCIRAGSRPWCVRTKTGAR